MQEMKALFSKELIDLDISVTSVAELFSEVNEKLLELGYVNSGYLTGLTEREKQFPTGLITQHLNIALPHSDTQYIEKPFGKIHNKNIIAILKCFYERNLLKCNK